MMSLQMTGDWNRAGIYLKNLSKRITPFFEAKLYEDGQMVLQKMKDHVYNQDLNWTPLKERTVQLKNGDTTILIETGELVEGLVCRRIKSTVKGSTIYIGASPWKTHSGGMKMSDLMIWLEYGTDRLPPRPLIAPTFEEVKDELKDGWKEAVEELLREGF